MVRQCFVWLQPVIDMMNPQTQALGIYPSVHTPDRVGAAFGLTAPVVEEAGASGQFQSIEATHSCPEQDCDGLEDDGGRDTRLQAAVNDAGDDRLREPEELLGISDPASENGQRFLARRRFHSRSETSFTRRW